MIIRNGCVADVMIGDCRQILADLKRFGTRVQTCVTSPPYYGLRDYGHAGQLGLEETPDAYIAAMVEVFRGVRDVLANDGTLWVNIGDSYAGGGSGARDPERWPKQSRNDHMAVHAKKRTGLKNKDLIGIPWMLAFALRADGWYLRQDIIWHKPNPMPESVTDRCTKAHEYIFLFSKSPKYYYNAGAILEPCSPNTHARISQDARAQFNSVRANGGIRSDKLFKAVGRRYDPGAGNKNNKSFNAAMAIMPEFRNKRSVWSVTTRGYKGAHFATFPPALIEPCILAGSRPGDIVLDPFGGSGTTGGVALAHGRNAILLELSAEYAALMPERINAIDKSINTPPYS